jgi:hypothetical protein
MSLFETATKGKELLGWLYIELLVFKALILQTVKRFEGRKREP